CYAPLALAISSASPMKFTYVMWWIHQWPLLRNWNLFYPPIPDFESITVGVPIAFDNGRQTRSKCREKTKLVNVLPWTRRNAMHVKEVMSAKPEFLNADATIREAARRMKDQACGCV